MTSYKEAKEQLKKRRPRTHVVTVEEAHDQVWSHLVKGDPGMVCPCCRQWCKLYLRKLNSNMVRFLRSLVRISGEDRRWVHHARCSYKGRDYAYLRHWGLAATRKKDPDDRRRRTSGYWQPTLVGINFVNNRCSVPAWLMVFNNVVFERSKERVTIVDAAGEDWDYDEMMQGTR